MKVRRLALAAGAVVLLTVLVVIPQLMTESTHVTSYLANLIFENNLHEVVPSRYYRSGQMTVDDLRTVIRTHGIKTVIDLRLGVEEPDRAGRLESDAAAAAGAAYYHLPLRSTRIPTREQIDELLALYDTVELPVLVHCSSGTHRTGVASALWMLTKEGGTLDESMHQLSVRYGFFRQERQLKSWFSGKPTIDNLIWRYADEAQRTGIDFRAWVARWQGDGLDYATTAVDSRDAARALN